MEIQLRMEGSLESLTQEEVSKEIKQLCEREQIRMEDYGDEFRLVLCPNGMINGTYESSFLTLEANTALVGPGFHHAVLEFMHSMQDTLQVAFTIEDSSDYVKHQDFSVLEAHFINWLNELREHHEDFSLWTHAQYEPLAKAGYLITPLGYVSESELMLLDDEVLSQTLFIWNHIEKDALFYRNSALALLWQDCFFDYTNMNEFSVKVAQEIVDRLEIAYEKDATIALPMRTYQQLCALLQVKPSILVAHQLDESEAIGYRFDKVAYYFGHWQIEAMGTCEWMMDSLQDMLILNAPYQDEDTPWSWTIQATHSDDRLANGTPLENEYGYACRYVVEEMDDYTIVTGVVESDECLKLQFIYRDASFFAEALQILARVSWEKPALEIPMYS